MNQVIGNNQLKILIVTILTLFFFFFNKQNVLN